MRLSICQ